MSCRPALVIEIDPEGIADEASFQPSIMTTSSSHNSTFCKTLTRRTKRVKMPGLDIDKNPTQRALRIGINMLSEKIVVHNAHVKATELKPVTGGPDALEKSILPLSEDDT